MAGTGKSRANENRRIRQEALREQLSNGKHVEHVIDIAVKLSDLKEELEPVDIQRLGKAAEIKLKLIEKYLPNLKQVEVDADHYHTGELGGHWEVTFVNPTNASTDSKS